MLEGLLHKTETAQERADRKRAELLRSLEEDSVGDPIFTPAFFISLAVSSALSVGTGLLTRALTPRQKITRGSLAGQDLLLTRSELGIFITEIYGGDPATDAATLAVSTAYALNAKVVPAAFNGYYYRISVAGTTGSPLPALPTTAGSTVASGTAWIRCEGKTGGGCKVAPIIFWTSRDSEGRAVRKHTTTTRGGGGGGKGPKKPETTEVTYDLDAALMWGRGPLNLLKEYANSDVLIDLTHALTGVYDPTVPDDDPYTPTTMPGPNAPYTRPTARASGALATDGTGTRTGTTVGGGLAGFTFYPGNASQLPDPTIQAETDARTGAGSTPAYRGRAFTLHKAFYLTKWGGALPNFSGVVEHQTLKTLALVYAHWCGRTGVLTSSDYDFSALATLDLRGLPLGQRYEPAGVMESLAQVFNVYFFETDKIYGRVRGSQSAVASLTDADTGWVDGDEEDDEGAQLEEVTSEFKPETEIPRRYDIKLIDPARDFEQNAQGDSRQITSSEKVETIDLPITMYPEESRVVTQRELYEAQIEAEKDTAALDWSYLWVVPGDTVTVTRAAGFTHKIFIESIKPNIGVIPIEGVAEEVTVYAQPVSTSGGGVFETPPVPIPGQTLLGFYDGPLLRDEENTENNGAGLYAYPVKRRGDGRFAGSALYVDRGLGYELLDTFDKEATFGVTTTVLTATTNVHDIVADAVTVDLHNSSATLASNARADLWNGAGACIVGDEVCQILTATRDTSNLTLYPNRWNLIIGLRARRGSDYFIDAHAVGERFVLVDDAVRFVPLNVNELNVTRNYKMVTSGQSVDDAAIIAFAWTGGSVKDLSPVNVRRSDDSAGNSLVEFTGRRRLGHGLHGGQSGLDDPYLEKYEIDIFTDSTRATVVRTIPVAVGIAQAAVIISNQASKFTGVAVNTLSTIGSIRGRTLQQVTRAGNYAEAILVANGGAFIAEQVGFGFVRPAADWRGPGSFSFYNIAEFDYFVELYNTGSGLELRVYVRGTLGYSAAHSGTSAKVRLIFSGSEVRFVENWTGPGTPPFYVSPLAPVFPYHVAALLESSGTTVRVDKLVMTTDPDPKTIYNLAQQTQDFGSAQATLHANIYEVDSRVGRGYPAKVTLANSF